MLLCVPIVGSDGSVYGVCGVELSALYFQLSYPAAEGRFGSAVTVLAPIQDSRLLLSDGLWAASTVPIWTVRRRSPSIRDDTITNMTQAPSGIFGLHQTISISKGETEDTAWAAAILIPQDSYAAYTAEIQKTWIIAALGLLVVLLALSFFLARRFVRPITDSLKRVPAGRTAGTGAVLRDLGGG